MSSSEKESDKDDPTASPNSTDTKPVNVHEIQLVSSALQTNLSDIHTAVIEAQDPKDNIQQRLCGQTQHVEPNLEDAGPSDPLPLVDGQTSLDAVDGTSTTLTEDVTATVTNFAAEDVITPVSTSIFSDEPPMQQSQLPEQDQNVLKYFVILRPTGPAAAVLAKACQTLYCGGTSSVKDYCISTLGLSNAQYKKIFTAHERDTLEMGTDWGLLDITFLYKLLQRVCGLASSFDKKWAEPESVDVDGIEHSLYLVKGERNFLAHEATVLTDEQLQQRSQKLLTLLENVLHKISLRANVDCSSDIDCLKSKIQEILHCSSSFTLETYRNELQILRNDLVSKVISESQSELFPYYLNLWSSSTAWWSQDHNIIDDTGNEVPRLEQVFTNITIKDGRENELSINDLFGYYNADQSTPRLLIVEGIAGTGKSHICKYILYRWASQQGSDVNLHNIDLIIFIQCHAVNSSSLREFLSEELLQSTCSTLRHEDIIPAVRKCKVIFIIDGVDEAGSYARDMIKEINIKFSDSRVLITCRPEFTKEAKHLLSRSSCKNVCTFYAKGFNKSQRKEYLGKILKVVKLKCIDHKDAVDQLYQKIQEAEQSLHSLLCLPLTVMMLVLLWLDDAASLSVTTTVTHIHRQTVDLRIKQLTQRIYQKSGESRHRHYIERLCRKWLLALSKVALKTLRSNTQVLDENSTSELMDEAEANNIDAIDALSCFLNCKTRDKIFDTEYVWEFFHKAFQEYLSAFYISKYPEVLCNIGSQISKSPRKENHEILDDVLRNNKKFSSRLSDTSSKSSLWSTGSPSASLTYKDKCNQSIEDNSSKPYEESRPMNHNIISSMLQAVYKCITCQCKSKPLYEQDSVNYARGTRKRGKARKKLPMPKVDRGMYYGGPLPSLLPEGTPAPPDISYRYSYLLPDTLPIRHATSVLPLPPAISVLPPPPPPGTSVLPPPPPPGTSVLPHSPTENTSVPASESIYDSDIYSTYEIMDEDLLKKMQLLNTLQFLGAMEASNTTINLENMMDIIKRFKEAMCTNQWLSWATFIRECGEHPIVCQLVKKMLDGEKIQTLTLGIDVNEYLDAILYLLEKTNFRPSKIEFWFTKIESFPKSLGSLLSKVNEISPSTTVELSGLYHHCSALKLCVSQSQKLDINLRLQGKLEREFTNDFVTLLKYIEKSNVSLILDVIIECLLDLVEFASVEKVMSLPDNVKLRLYLKSVSDEMVFPLSQILSIYSWKEEFSLAFSHTDLSNQVTTIHELLSNALQNSEVQVHSIDLCVEAYAESNFTDYERLASGIAEDAYFASIFDDGADGDNVTLVLRGTKKAHR